MNDIKTIKTYDIETSVNCDYKVNLLNWNNKTLEVSFKPFSYPCVMVLEGDEDFHDNTWCNVMFVYKDDFKN